MKIFFFVLLFSFSFSFAFAEIPDSIKQETKQYFFSKSLDEKSVSAIISDIISQKLIKNIKETQQIFTIPIGGETKFIPISDRIDEFGKTSRVDLQIIHPDGKLEKISTPLLETGVYSTIYSFDRKSLPGTYQIETKFEGSTKSISYFHLIKNELPNSNFPLWLVRTFTWWSQDRISDFELTNSLQHLADLGLIVNSRDPSPSLHVVITGEELIRRGTMQTINVLVTDGYSPIEGAKITLTIENYGKDIIRDFKGFTKDNGYFVFSWEIPKSFNDYETLLAYISVSNGKSSQTQLWKFQVYCLPGTENCKIDGN